MSDIAKRLRASVKLGAAHGTSDERAVCERQMTEAADTIERMERELETERMRLAACSTAALGYFKGCADEYKSAALDDVLRLYEKAYPPHSGGHSDDSLLDLVSALRSGEQADPDGVMVKVSRQACEEAARYIEQSRGGHSNG